MSTSKNTRIKCFATEEENEAPGEKPPPSFPVECLPKVLRDMVEAVAKLERVPAAMAAPMALAVASASLGKGVLIRGLQGRDTPPNLYVAVAKESGTGGSRAYHHIVKPLEGLQALIIRNFKTSVAPGLEVDKETLNVDIEKQKKIFKDAKDDETRHKAREVMHEAKTKIRAIEDELREPLFMGSDVTQESLAERLAAAGETFAQFNSDASDALSTMLGCYRDKQAKGGSHSLWLKAFSCESNTVARTNKGIVHLATPCLAVLFVVTPPELRKHYDDDALKDSGLLGRLLSCDPGAVMSSYETFEEAKQNLQLPSGVSQAYEAAIWKTAALYRKPRCLSPESDDDSEFAPDEDDKPLLMECEEDALRVFWEDHRDMSARWKEAAIPRELIARFNEHAIRIAAVIHVFKHMHISRKCEEGETVNARCDVQKHTLDAATARDAVAIRNWFSAHLTAFLTSQQDATTDNAFASLRLKASHMGWDKAGITPREIYTHKIGGAKDGREARALLGKWEREGKMHKQDRKGNGTGRKPAAAWYFSGLERGR